MKHLLAELLGIIGIIFLVVNLAGPVANFTTGITVSHTGFTPNPNITYVSTGTKTNPTALVEAPGITPLLQMIPFLFMGIVLLFLFYEIEHIFRGTAGSLEANSTTGISIPEIEEPPPPWNCHNCGGPNPNEQKVCQYCGKVYPGDFTTGFWKYQ